MSNLPMYKIIITNYFKKQLKPLVKKNCTLKETLKIDKILTPIAIYSKNQKENLTLDELSNSLEQVKDELISFL